jgi:Fe-S-cluster-containing dehydrogenase component
MEVAHPYSPFGVVELRAQSCTGCLACAQACPTGALALERKKDSIVLTYEASLCNGCRICADVCPEAAAGALTVRRMTRLDALSTGRVTLHKAHMAVCDGCGEAFASQAMLRRIGAQIGEDNTALNTALSRYCPSCRMTFALGARPAS